jgi:short subunit dehydrogenase-like uncharacterized protein
MIDKFYEKAIKTGAQIVHFCGHDSIPWDLLFLLLNNKLRYWFGY